MMNKIRVVTAALCCSLAASAPAQEFGQIPYATIHKVMTRLQSVKNPKLRGTVAIQPKGKSTNPQEITLTVQAKSGPIKVPVEKDGEIRSFPMSDALLKENPPVLSNLPKGQSQLVAGLQVVLPDTLTHSYRDLAELLQEANSEMKKQAGMMSMMMPKAKALVVQFRGAGKQTVTIEGNERKVLAADADGSVRLEIEKELVAPNPQVVLSEKPAKVLVN
jgi:predicted regulator of Ras-like GTPase activity (Roadblock/LC7/MglB family)